MLTIKQVRKIKGEPKAEHFGLFYGSSQWLGKNVPSKFVLQLLKQSVDKGTKTRKTLEENIEKVLEGTAEVTEKVIKCNPDTTIVEEFTLTNANGSVNVDPESFTIRYNYLPDDDKAPDRIYGIVSEFHSIVHEFYEHRLADSVKEKTDEFVEYPAVTIGYDDDGNSYLARYEGTDVVEDTREEIPVKEVLSSMIFYKVTYMKKVRNEVNAPLVTKSGKKYLKGAVVSFNDGSLSIDNLEDYDTETQTVINEIIEYFRLA